MADSHIFAGAGHPDVAGWVLGALDLKESVLFETHLESCPQCQQAVTELGTTAQMLKTANSLPGMQLAGGPEPPPDLQARTLARVQRAARKTARRRWSPRWALPVGAAAAAAAAAIALILARSAPALTFTIPLHPHHGITASGQAFAHHTDDGWSITLTVHSMPKLRPGQFYECWYVGPGNQTAHSGLVTAGTFTVNPAGSAAVQMWSAADPRAFPVMEITIQEAGDAGQPGAVLLSGTAQK
jgi:hypothetical protein